MNGKIIEYIAVTSSDHEWFTKRVNDNIKEGWQPFGSLQVTVDDEGDTYSQAMVKYEITLYEPGGTKYNEAEGKINKLAQ